MFFTQRTRKSAPVSATPPREYERPLTDAAVYLLAFGGLYITSQTIYALARFYGFPVDQAIVVAGLADLAVLVYSWKAKQEVQAGRSAWFIRLMVALMSVASFSLQIKAAYPDPTAMVLHALPSLVWIFGHEFMLRGKLRDARWALRQQEIADGLRPAPLDRIRIAEWLFAPRRTFQVWKMMIFWRRDRAFVTRQKVAQWQQAASRDRKGRLKPVPAPWQWALTDEVSAPAVVRPAVTVIQQRPRVATVLGALKPADLVLPEQPRSIPEPPRSSTLRPDGPARAIGGQKIPESFFAELPEAPEKGRRTTEDCVAYMDQVEKVADRYGFETSGLLFAHLLDVAPSRISQMKRERLAVGA